MTLEESKQIHYIIKEISVLQRELAELKMKNPYKQNIITDMPRGGGGSVGIEMALGRPVDIAINHEPDADFINCVAFGRSAEFAEKYLRQGLRIIISGRIQTGSYTNRDGEKAYFTNIIVESQEFAESKHSRTDETGDGFMNIPDGLDEELPFS